MTNGPRTRCPVCSSHRLSGLPFGYVFKERTLSALMCSACEIIFLVPRPTEEDIRQLYSREYFEHDFRCGHTTSYFDPHTHSAIVDRELIARLRARAPARRLLEVGCAGGALLDALRCSCAPPPSPMRRFRAPAPELPGPDWVRVRTLLGGNPGGRLLADVWTEMARAAFLRGDRAEGLRRLDLALGADPGFEEARRLRARAAPG